MKQFILYLIRWQLSTPILAIVLKLLANIDVTIATIIANLIGGVIFFWIDKLIFRKDNTNEYVRKSDIRYVLLSYKSHKLVNDDNIQLYDAIDKIVNGGEKDDSRQN